MFRAMAVDSSVLLLSCYSTTGALGSSGLLSSCSITTNNKIVAYNHYTHNAMSFCISTSLHLYISTSLHLYINNTMQAIGLATSPPDPLENSPKEEHQPFYRPFAKPQSQLPQQLYLRATLYQRKIVKRCIA